MLTSKHIDRICCMVLAVMLLSTAGMMGLGVASNATYGKNFGYVNDLFDQSVVHTIEIVMDDWDAFLKTATDEVYSACTVIIDGETFKNVGIRGKGNTSLSTVSQYNSSRYSFKIEFDHYQKGYTYHGLDKLCLNNIIQDNTYMKDYLAYTLMNKMNVPSPLCSFANILVNGETWGLYLAVEAVEDSFIARNYGTRAGDLYKPDSTSMGGGRGNGRDFDLDAFLNQDSEETEATEDAADSTAVTDAAETEESDISPSTENTQGSPVHSETSSDFMQGGFPGMGMGQGGFSGQMMGPGDMNGQPGGMPDMTDFDPAQMGSMPDPGSMGGFPGGMGDMGGQGFDSGMGSDAVKLLYIDDDSDSYSDIFDNAKTKVTKKDKKRLIAAIKKMNEQDTSAIDTEEVIRYLAVHDFMQNDDSYTGSMIHNYYLREYDGVLSMIPWDYNLSVGGFGNVTDGTETVNSPIDNPVDASAMSSRPMVAWIFGSEEWTERYHEVYQEFVDTWINSGWVLEEIDRVSALIDSYVQDDPTKFCTYDDFVAGVEVLRAYCERRGESIQGQLEGTIPPTEAGQTNSDVLIDASDLDLTLTGGMNQGGGMPGGMPGSMGSGGHGDMGGGMSMGGRGGMGFGSFDPNAFGSTTDLAAMGFGSDFPGMQGGMGAFNPSTPTDMMVQGTQGMPADENTASGQRNEGMEMPGQNGLSSQTDLNAMGAAPGKQSSPAYEIMPSGEENTEAADGTEETSMETSDSGRREHGQGEHGEHGESMGNPPDRDDHGGMESEKEDTGYQLMDVLPDLLLCVGILILGFAVVFFVRGKNE